jgi:hypothetical protein
MKLPKFVICGIEHSGTTLVSDIFRQNPICESGFETGVLLTKSPLTFKNVSPWFDLIINAWGITTEQREKLCLCEDFNSFYDSLIRFSNLIKPEHTIFFDKTPRYLSQLWNCHSRMPIPFIILYKDPRAIILSNWKRYKGGDSFGTWCEKYQRSKYLDICFHRIEESRKYPSDFFPISLEEICKNPADSIERIFNFVGVPFDISYLNILNSRYAHTKGNHIISDLPYEYKTAFTATQLEIIDIIFARFKKWFINND